MKRMSGMPTSWIVITGAPCAGKTTTLSVFADEGYRVVHEVAREYIEDELRRGRSLAEIRRDEAAFQRGLIELKLRVEDQLPPNEIVLLDRAIPDSLAYFRIAGLPTEELDPVIGIRRYQAVLLFERLPMISDGVRTEDDAAATALERWIEADYRRLGYAVTRVPVMPIADRVALVKDHIASGR